PPTAGAGGAAPGGAVAAPRGPLVAADPQSRGAAPQPNGTLPARPTAAPAATGEGASGDPGAAGGRARPGAPRRPPWIVGALAGAWDAFGRAFDDAFDRLRAHYARLLGWALQHRWLPPLLGVALLVGAIALVPLGFIKSEYLTPLDYGMFTV